MYNDEIMIEKVRKNRNDMIMEVSTPLGQFSRNQIVEQIKKGIHVYTCTKQGIGSRVEIYPYNGLEDIRSIEDKITDKNLDNLPTY